MKYWFSFFLIICATDLFSQISVSSNKINFPEIKTNNKDSLSIYIKNDGNKSEQIKLNNYIKVFSLTDTLLELSAGDSVLIWIKYCPIQNVIDKDIIFISGNDSTSGNAIEVSGSGKFGDVYDAATFNLYDSQLKSALTQLISNHISLGYNLARDKMFMEIDNKKVNGEGALQNTLECVYTGRLAVGYVDRTDAQNNYNFNTEHTWPQSNFNENEPMKSDLYHLYPTDNPANGIRSNYPFGNVISNITWQQSGSKLGTNNVGQIVFEPRDIHKGDVSRSMFYFITRYPVNYGGFFTQTQETVFREWNKLDTVSEKEFTRNNSISAYQKNRNPFIDHPEFVDRIYSFVTNTNRPVYSQIDVLPLKLLFDTTSISDTTYNKFYIANSGTKILSIDSIKSSDTRFRVESSNLQIEPYSVKEIPIAFVPDIQGKSEAIIIVYSEKGQEQIKVSGNGVVSPVNVNEYLLTPQAFALEQNYPNPFNPSTEIEFRIGNREFVNLIVFDLLGRKVATLLNEEKASGAYKVKWNAENLPSGVYFYKLQAGNFTSIKKMLLLK